MLDATLTPTISRLLHPLISLDTRLSPRTLSDIVSQLLTLLRDADHPCSLLESSPGVARNCWLSCYPAFTLDPSTGNFKFFRLSLNCDSPHSYTNSFTLLHLSFDLDPHTNQYLPSISS